MDLASLIDHNNLSVMNATDDAAVANIFKEELRDSDDLTVTSDADEQLLIYCPFRETVKIQSIAIKGPADGSGPAIVKIFKNAPGGAMDFDDASNGVPTQEIEFTTENLDGRWTALKFVSFQSVSSLTFFVESNTGDEDATVIQKIGISGAAINGTNMDDLKACG